MNQNSGTDPRQRARTISSLRARMASIEQESEKRLGADDSSHQAVSAAVAQEGAERSSEDGESDRVRQEKDPREAAFQRIINLCSYHDFSREKMRKRLKREQISDAAAHDALDRAVACGLIDDIRYGEALCAGRMHAGRGQRGIESELWEHHIDPASIDGWPQAYEERYGREFDRALSVIERHPPRSQNPRASAYRRLVGKGYAPAIASRASRTWWDSQQTRD